jgi:hypothetical protein
MFGKFERGCMRNLLALLFALLFLVDIADGEIGALCKHFPASPCPCHNYLIKNDVKLSLPINTVPVLATGAPSPCTKSVHFPFTPCCILPVTPERVFQGTGCGGLPA